MTSTSNRPTPTTITEFVTEFVPMLAPQHIAEGEVFTVPENTEMLFNMGITVDGDLVLDGWLVEV